MLNDFFHKGDVKSPNIILNTSGTLEFQGRSLPENAKEIFTEPDVDGGLIGGASLKAEDFMKIANSF